VALLYYDPRLVGTKRRKRYAIYCDGSSYAETGWSVVISMGVGSEWSWEAMVVVEPNYIPATYTWGYMFSDIVCSYSHWTVFLGVSYSGDAGSFASSATLLSYIENYPVTYGGVPLNAPAHLVATWRILDVRKFELQHFVNGSRVYYNPRITATYDLAFALDRTTISSGRAWRGGRFKGRILWIRGYTKALTPSEVAHNMQNPFNPVRDRLAVWYMFEEYGRGTAYDISGNGRHLNVSSLRWVTLP